MSDVSKFALGAVTTASTLAVIVVLILFGYGPLGIVQAIQALGSIAVACSAFVAYRVYKSNSIKSRDDIQRDRSRQFKEEAILALERAHDAFTSGETVDGMPRADRLLWLTTARILVRYKRLKSLVTDQAQLTALLEHEEHWRHQFYLDLDSALNHFTVEYFSHGRPAYDGDEIEPASILAVFDFAKWPENEEDPMDDVDDAGLLARNVVSPRFRGVLNYLERFPALQGRAQAIKEGN